MFLQGKRVLFVAPDMYYYASGITQAMEAHGASVTYLRDRPQHLTARVLRNISPATYERIRGKYLHAIDVVLSDSRKYDMLFIINGTALTPAFLKNVRNRMPSLQIILYSWDIHAKHPYLHLVPYTDTTFVFDRSEADLYPGLEYLPLFFTDSYRSLRKAGTNHYRFDLLHIGTFHEGKYRQVRQIDRILRQAGMKAHWLLVITFSNWVKRTLRGEIFFGVRFRGLSQQDVIALYGETRAVLDLPVSGQKGLTMRTFEVLGAHKKLVTTNLTIRNEAIYAPELVYILEYDDRPLSGFIAQEVQLTPQLLEKIEQYSIHSWLRRIFGLKGGGGLSS